MTTKEKSEHEGFEDPEKRKVINDLLLATSMESCNNICPWDQLKQQDRRHSVDIGKNIIRKGFNNLNIKNNSDLNPNQNYQKVASYNRYKAMIGNSNCNSGIDTTKGYLYDKLRNYNSQKIARYEKEFELESWSQKSDRLYGITRNDPKSHIIERLANLNNNERECSVNTRTPKFFGNDNIGLKELNSQLIIYKLNENNTKSYCEPPEEIQEVSGMDQIQPSLKRNKTANTSNLVVMNKIKLPVKQTLDKIEEQQNMTFQKENRVHTDRVIVDHCLENDQTKKVKRIGHNSQNGHGHLVQQIIADNHLEPDSNFVKFWHNKNSSDPKDSSNTERCFPNLIIRDEHSHNRIPNITKIYGNKYQQDKHKLMSISTDDNAQNNGDFDQILNIETIPSKLNKIIIEKAKIHQIADNNDPSPSTDVDHENLFNIISYSPNTKTSIIKTKIDAGINSPKYLKQAKINFTNQNQFSDVQIRKGTAKSKSRAVGQKVHPGISNKKTNFLLDYSIPISAKEPVIDISKSGNIINYCENPKFEQKFKLDLEQLKKFKEKFDQRAHSIIKNEGSADKKILKSYKESIEDHINKQNKHQRFHSNIPKDQQQNKIYKYKKGGPAVITKMPMDTIPQKPMDPMPRNITPGDNSDNPTSSRKFMYKNYLKPKSSYYKMKGSNHGLQKNLNSIIPLASNREQRKSLIEIGENPEYRLSDNSNNQPIDGNEAPDQIENIPKYKLSFNTIEKASDPRSKLIQSFVDLDCKFVKMAQSQAMPNSHEQRQIPDSCSYQRLQTAQKKTRGDDLTSNINSWDLKRPKLTKHVKSASNMTNQNNADISINNLSCLFKNIYYEPEFPMKNPNILFIDGLNFHQDQQYSEEDEKKFQNEFLQKLDQDIPNDNNILDQKNCSKLRKKFDKHYNVKFKMKQENHRVNPHVSLTNRKQSSLQKNRTCNSTSKLRSKSIEYPLAPNPDPPILNSMYKDLFDTIKQRDKHLMAENCKHIFKDNSFNQKKSSEQIPPQVKTPHDIQSIVPEYNIHFNQDVNYKKYNGHISDQIDSHRYQKEFNYEQMLDYLKSSYHENDAIGKDPENIECIQQQHRPNRNHSAEFTKKPSIHN